MTFSNPWIPALIVFLSSGIWTLPFLWIQRRRAQAPVAPPQATPVPAESVEIEPDPAVILAERTRAVADIVGPLFPGEPWVMNGRFNWFRLEGETLPRPISLFFLDLALVIQVLGPELTPVPAGSGLWTYQGNERDLAAAQMLRRLCRREKVLLMEIPWDRPIEAKALRSALITLGALLPDATETERPS